MGLGLNVTFVIPTPCYNGAQAFRKARVSEKWEDQKKNRGQTCQPASMVLRSLPKAPEMTQICERLNSAGDATCAGHTFRLALAP